MLDSNFCLELVSLRLGGGETGQTEREEMVLYSIFLYRTLKSHFFSR